MSDTKIRLLPRHRLWKVLSLAVLASLKEAIETEQIVAFCAVGIEEGDETRMWSATTKPVTRLRMIGAMYHLLHSFETGVE